MKNNQNDTSNFLKSLSERHWIENNISDFLYALFKSSDGFKYMFVEIISTKCDKYSPLKTKIYDAFREYNYCDGVGRADILLKFWGDPNRTIEEKPLLIEVKVTDKDYHADKYNPCKTDYNICLIDKLKHEDTDDFEDWILITWDEILNKMESSNLFLETKIALFFRGALNMEKITKKVNLGLDQLESFASFLKMIRKISKDLLGCRIYDRDDYFTETTFGYYFGYTNRNKKEIWCWFGINCTTDNGYPIGTLFWVRQNWNKENYDYIFNSLASLGATKNDSEIVIADVNFINKINTITDVENQTDFMYSYIRNIFNFLDQV